MNISTSGSYSDESFFPSEAEKLELAKSTHIVGNKRVVETVKTRVKFNQRDVIYGSTKLPDNLKKISSKFNGLCELICNKILIDNLLGKGGEDLFEKEITVQELSKESIIKSHLLNVYPVSNKVVAFLFGIYSDNIFSIKNQWGLVNRGKVNEKIFLKGLAKLEEDAILKVEVLKKVEISFIGHSLLIKKTGPDKFTFFDPNTGEHRGLSKTDLIERINDQLRKWSGTDIFLSRGESYLKRLVEKNIIKRVDVAEHEA